MVEPPTRPRPISWIFHQSSLYRVPMHILKLFRPFGFAPDIEAIEAPLPNSVRGLIVNGFRQHDLIQHPSAPRLFATLQALDHAPSRPLFETTDNARWAMNLAGPDEQMKVLRHQDVADESEVKLMSQGI